MTIPLFTLTGDINKLVGGTKSPPPRMILMLKSNIRPGDLLAIDGVAEFIGQVNVLLDGSGKINGDTGIKLLANDDSLGLSTPVQWTVSSSGLDGYPAVNPWTFDAPNAGETLDLLDAMPVPGITAVGTTRGPAGPAGPPGPPGPQSEPGFSIDGGTAYTNYTGALHVDFGGAA